MIRVDWLITGLNILGGAEIFTTRLAHHMATYGVQLRVITLRSGGELITTLINQGIPVIEVGLSRKINPLPLFRLYALWRKTPPDILHTHLYHAGIFGRLIGWFARIQVIIVHQHGTENNRSALRSFIDRVTSSIVDQYIVPSQAVADVLSTRERIERSKILSIHYGIDINTNLPIHPFPVSTTTAEVPVIGCVSRLVPEKGHPVLLHSLQRLNQNGIPFQAIMVGDGPERNNLEQLTRQLELANDVSWIGNQHDIPSWLSKFDIFVLPSAWEGLPISILEAMAARLPVIATSVGGTPEAVINNQTGILVPPDDPGQLFLALHRLIQNPTLRIRMGNAGRHRVEENFSITLAAENMQKVYRRLLDIAHNSTTQNQSHDG